MMKRSINIILIISFLIVMFCPITNVKAMTLQEYKNKVAALKNKQYENNKLTAETENKIRNKRNEIIEATNKISENEQKVEDSKTLVAESHENIKIKQEELKDVIVALQYTESNSKELYTDYIFSASSISDMMERQAIAAQIVNYTQGELDSLEKLIKDNEALQVKLADDNVNLNESITKYEAQLEELDKYIDSLASIGLDYASQIEAQEGMIKIYEAAGCKNGDDIDVCYYAGGSGAFMRPLVSGKVTQAYNKTHAGIDLGGNNPGTSIYAPANGTIVYVKNKYSCGGNIIYMHSFVGGKKYTLEFAHLRSINVKIGQSVKQGQVIGTVGGDQSTWYYDSCTSGTHLHYAISNGYYFGNATWNEFYTFKANTTPTGNKSISSINSSKGWTWKTR